MNFKYALLVTVVISISNKNNSHDPPGVQKIQKASLAVNITTKQLLPTFLCIMNNKSPLTEAQK